MRAVVQRVSSASVTIDGEIKARIGHGLLVLLAVEDSDTMDDDVEWLGGKLVHLRIFADEQGVMNRSVQDVGGDILVVSQFTLYASTKKGNRPSYVRAAKPEFATHLYHQFIGRLATLFGKDVYSGKFGADMKVALVNDGPVTILFDTKARE